MESIQASSQETSRLERKMAAISSKVPSLSPSLMDPLIDISGQVAELKLKLTLVTDAVTEVQRSNQVQMVQR